MVNSGVWQIPTAVITIPSSEYSVHIPYATKIHVFEWEANKEEWILLFDGYASGIMAQKTSAAWNTQISCIGYGRIWQRIFKYLYYLDEIVDKQEYDELYGSTEMIPVRAYFQNLVKLYAKDNNVFDAVSNILTWKSGNTYTANGKERNTPKTMRANALPSFVNKFLYGAANLAKRLCGLETSASIKKILQAAELKQMMHQSSQSMNGATTLFDLAALVMRNSRHEMLSVNQPTYDSTGLHEYVIKPVSHYLYPPKCNVIHPGYISSISYSQNYEAEPTRLACTVAPWVFTLTGQEVPKGQTAVKYAPELGGAFTDISITEKDANYKVSKWEKEYGLNIAVMNLPSNIGIAFRNNESKLQDFINMDYMERCSTSRQLSVMIDPMMQVAPGSSVLLLDGTEVRGHLIGLVSSVSRAVSAVGQSSIGLTLSNPRLYSEIVDGYASEVDPLFKDYSELKKFYKLLGTKPAFSSNDGNTVRKEIDDYAKMEKVRWTRDICTQEEFMSFTGLSWNGTDLTGSLYSSTTMERDKFWGRATETSKPSILSLTRQDLVRKHNKVLAKGGIRG